MSKGKEKKIRIILMGLYMTVVVSAALLICSLQYRTYQKNYNSVLSKLCLILEEETELTAAEIMDILESREGEKADFFAKFGIDRDTEAAVKENRKAYQRGLYLVVAAAFILGGLPIAGIILMEKRNERSIKRITRELADINDGRYDFDLNSSSEGSLSILENELYKTAITLKEAAENSQKDKESLKDSLSDISHQLKTPLTSLSISLENLEEYPELPIEKRQVIINRAKRDVNKVNQMVQLLLKLSRFDANAIEFHRAANDVRTIIDNAYENVKALCDLKGIEVIISPYEDKTLLNCDAYWETEAVTNILKNGIEHAEKQVTVSYKNYELYSEIVIENDGMSISDEDARNAFNRFYRGEQATADSVGIGLALAEAIVKEDGGYIIAEAIDHGSRFIIRYTENKDKGQF